MARGAAGHPRRGDRRPRRRWRTRSPASSCCRFASCGRIRRRTFSPSVCPTRSPPRCRAIGSLIVRSSAVAARFGSDAPDLKALAADADVDRVVMGTLLRSGDQLRAVGAAGRSAGGNAAHVAHRPVVAWAICSSCRTTSRGACARRLSLPLSGGTTSPAADAPNDARAYELYLRANELARTYDGLAAARDLYQRCLALDSRFAPAWAHLGRCHRVIGKYIDERRRQRGACRRGASAARSRSARGCRSRTSSTRSSKPISATPRRRSSGSLARPIGTATIRSSLPASSTPVATAACTNNRSPRMPRPAGSTRTCRRASIRPC